ncbi:MAG: ribonuclease P protein component [Anaerolineales bacterium]|nr:ribonuclease P protein component [Anaerolineales bacterium]
MDRIHRLASASDVDRVRRLGRSQASPLMVVVAGASDLPYPRFAFVAGKGVGGAVKRNRAKRRMRALVQAHLPQVASGKDIVLIARTPLLAAEWPVVLDTGLRLLQRAGALHD